MAQTQGVHYKSVNWGKDRPAEGQFRSEDVKLAFETSGEKIDRYFTLRRTNANGDYCWIEVSFHKDIVYGESKILDDFIDSWNGNLFERPELDNLNELHFRRMLGVFYGYDMNYIEDEQELEELYRIANLFKAQSVEEFCCEKLAKFPGRNAPGASSSSEGSANDWVVLENVEVEEENSTPDPPKFPDQIVEVSANGIGAENDEVRVPQTPGKSGSSSSKTTMSSIKAEILSDVIAALKPELTQELAAGMKDEIKEIILEDLRSEIEDRLRSDDDLKEQLVSEIMEILREEIKQELMNDADLKARLFADIRSEIIQDHDLTDDLVTELKEEFVPELKEEMRGEIFDELKDRLKTMLLDDDTMRDELVEEIRSEILDDADLKTELSQSLMESIRNEFL
ncbi:uncharacterized protein LOC110860805 [Folsomia candida]|uniref:uncharacterized protein LOC110860805 n=1 Tax=Folsomia candida TaxID=158441 RepID=UPI000B8F3BCF|nr:uncharacterized protein LOC110860805 [Folsomia candida]